MFTLVLLWLCVLLGAVFLAYERWLIPRWGGPDLAQIPLRTRGLGDYLVLVVIVLAAYYHERQNQAGAGILLALGALLVVLTLIVFRRRVWHLKARGFWAGFRLIPYDAIAAMQLSEDGILRLSFHNQATLDLAMRDLAALEQAAAFLTTHLEKS